MVKVCEVIPKKFNFRAFEGEAKGSDEYFTVCLHCRKCKASFDTVYQWRYHLRTKHTKRRRRKVDLSEWHYRLHGSSSSEDEEGSVDEVKGFDLKSVWYVF